MNRWLAIALLCACASDESSRRATLEASLVNPSNGYSTLRLAHYATGKPGDWDALPEWNPPSEPLDETTRANPTAPLSATAAPLALDDAPLALGEAAFFRYPIQLLTANEVALIAADASAYGFWSDASRGVGGLVRVRVADGSTALAYTCATCHASSRNGAFIIGLTNAALDLGRFIIDSSPGDSRQAALLAWGPGRVDVTTNEGTEPVRIPDVRSVRVLTHLHATASVIQRDLPTLAIRLETLIIVTQSQTIRPPREVTLALATYVWSLADTLTTRAPTTDAELAGQVIFAERCASCHAPPNYTGPPVPLAVVGTDPVIGLSLDRRTGNYRVPSLLGVADRPLLIHDGSATSLDEMFDPTRTSSGYVGRLGGPIVGHEFGLDLSAGDRAALLSFLRTL